MSTETHFLNDVDAVLLGKIQTPDQMRQLMDETKKLVDEAIADIQHVYLDPLIHGPFTVSYSGGKDSSALLAIVMNAIEALAPEKRTREIHIVSSDTRAENPIIHDHLISEHKKIRARIDSEQLPKVIRYIGKTGYDRKGREQIDKTGRVRHDWGTLSVEAREYLLEELLLAQAEMNEIRMEDYDLEYYTLIDQEEVDYIRAEIAEDRKLRPWLAKGLETGKYRELYERKLREIIVEKHGQTLY